MIGYPGPLVILHCVIAVCYALVTAVYWRHGHRTLAHCHGASFFSYVLIALCEWFHVV